MSKEKTLKGLLREYLSVQKTINEDMLSTVEQVYGKIQLQIKINTLLSESLEEEEMLNNIVLFPVNEENVT